MCVVLIVVCEKVVCCVVIVMCVSVDVCGEYVLFG